MSDTPRTDDVVMQAVAQGMRLAPVAEFCRELERENAALRAERVLVSVHTGEFTTISGRAMICPDCGRALLHEDRAAIDAARKQVQS